MSQTKPMADDDVEVADKRVGTTIHGKYRLDAVLGSGGMGVVYCATHLDLERRVALKMMHASWAQKRAVRLRFVREGRAANQVGHPAVVDITDSGTAEDGTPYLVMDLLKGETLEQRWARKGKRLEIAEVLERMHELLHVLSYAHKKGIIHRDLKPENIFITQARELKVLDFGIARVLHEERAPGKATQSGETMGTPGFMAPEQALGHHSAVDARTDLWSVGAIMFRLITGKLVHDYESDQEVVVRTATLSAPAIRTVRADVPEEVAAIIDTAVALEPAKRWPDAQSMRTAIGNAYATAFGKPIPRYVVKIGDSGRPPARLPEAQVVARAQSEESSTALASATSAPRRRLQWMAIAIAAASLVIVALVIRSRETRDSDMPFARTAELPRAATVTAPTNTTTASSEATNGGKLENVPLLSASELPNAQVAPTIPAAGTTTSIKPTGSTSASASPSASASASPSAPRMGKLLVGTSGGWCNVFVDDQPQGPTPVAGIEIVEGEHLVRCTTPDGKTLSASVKIRADETTRYKFTL